MKTKHMRSDLKMNKEELVRTIAQQSGFTHKVVGAALEAFLQVVKVTLSEQHKIVLVDFGTFEVHERAERRTMNPRTKEPILVPATKAPVFKAGKDFKARVAGKGGAPGGKQEATTTAPVEAAAPKGKKNK
jgi:DNA-binding protein HU-beta